MEQLRKVVKLQTIFIITYLHICKMINVFFNQKIREIIYLNSYQKQYQIRQMLQNHL